MTSVLKSELLATCCALGYSNGTSYVKEPDCFDSLKELILFLKRDDKQHEMRHTLGETKVLQSDLIPIVKFCKNDKELFDVVIRLLVNLTTPVLIVYDEVIPDEKVARRHYLELLTHLYHYKEALCDEEFWVVMSEKLHHLLKLEWEHRLENDNLVIERILVFIRNVLHVPPNPLIEKRTDDDASVHDRLLWCIHKCGIEELILYIVNSGDFAEFSLHCLEIITLMLRDQNAEALALAGQSRSQSEKEKDEKDLLEIRQLELSKKRLDTMKQSSRHSRFGGTFCVKGFKSISDQELLVYRPISDFRSLDLSKNKARQRKRKDQAMMQSSDTTRRSTLSIRLVLKEFCIEFLNSAYNSVMSIVKDQLARKHTQDHDESYYLWAIKFFMAFNRFYNFNIELVSETMSISTIHYIQTQLETYQEMMGTDKQKTLLWSKRMHLALTAYQELLLTIDKMDTSKEYVVRESAKTIKANLFYVLEYRELPVILLHHYDEVKLSRTYLKDLVEMTHIFLKMFEVNCKRFAHTLVQRKGRQKTSRKAKKKVTKESTTTLPVNLTEERLQDLWDSISCELSAAIQGNVDLPDNIVPFDAASDVPVDEQKGDAMRRIQGFLRIKQTPEAVVLFRSAREVWPENDCFGSSDIALEDEFLAMREVFFASLSEGPIFPENFGASTSLANEPDITTEQAEMESEGEDEELDEVVASQGPVRTEEEFDFKKFVARFASTKVVRVYALLFKNWEQNSVFTNHCIVKMFHRWAWDCKAPAILFQASLFCEFQKILSRHRIQSSDSIKEIIKFIKFVLGKFFEVAQGNKKVFVEMLFWKGLREAHEIEEGYSSYKEQSNAKARLLWTEDLEEELRHLYVSHKDKTDEETDVVDLIMDHFSDLTKTRRQIINQLKQMELLRDVKELKKPIKNKSTHSRVPREWSDEETNELRSLFDQHKDANDVVGRILDNLSIKRPKRRVVEKLLELGVVSDRKDLRKKSARRKVAKPSEKSRSGNGQTQTSKPSEGMVEDSNDDTSLSDDESVHSDDDSDTGSINSSVTVIRTGVELASNKDLSKLIKDVLESEGLCGSLKWIRDDLADISKDKLDDENLGAIPLVPIMQENHKAMENPIFLRLLKGLGLKPPADEQETYWRYPESLSSRVCQQSAHLLSSALNGVVMEESQHDDLLKSPETTLNQIGQESDKNVPIGTESQPDCFEEGKKPTTGMTSNESINVIATGNKKPRSSENDDEDSADERRRKKPRRRLIVESDSE